jgi:hypothetical protein
MSTWGVRGTLAALGIAIAIGAGGGAAVYAATDTGGRMMGPPHGGPPPQFDGGRHRVGAGADPKDADSGAGTAALHTESVVPDGSGGFVTRLAQTGRITAATPNSVSLVSDDGYATTYTIPKDLVAEPLHVGDRLVVDATREGEVAVVKTMRPPLASGN